MTEEIKTRQTAEEATSAAESGERTVPGSSRYGAERKAMASWAALLSEAVRRPGFIHEAYSRFNNYLLGNQLLGLFQCFEKGIPPGGGPAVSVSFSCHRRKLAARPSTRGGRQKCWGNCGTMGVNAC